VPLPDNRQFRTERQDDCWQLLLGSLQEIQDGEADDFATHGVEPGDDPIIDLLRVGVGPRLSLRDVKDIGLFIEVVLLCGHSGTPVRMLFVRYAVSTTLRASPTFTATAMYLPPRLSG
jgi:hypothetical protein